ncbi:MAG: hypothetical protein IT265_10325 [Saprospiraceae bacterium]|nr:hypothetical protein [Saprospiraceae bacterium]
MKSAVSILLALLILLQLFSKVWIIFSFKVNQDYIAKVVCINRDKPEKHCNGKCVLMKRIKAEEETEKKQIPQKLKEQQQGLYCLDNFSWLMQRPRDWANDKQKQTFSHQTPFTSAFVKGIFRPPKFVTVFFGLG